MSTVDTTPIGGDRVSPDGAGPSAPARALALALGIAQALVVPVLAIVSALAIGGLVIIFSDPDVLGDWGRFLSAPGTALSASWDSVFDAYRALLDSSLGSPTAVGRTLVDTTPLALSGLAVAIAFRAGLFNIGGAGQIIAGSILAGWVGFTFDLPTHLHLPAALLAGFVGGAAWGSIAGFLKARTGAHEVILTIMLNFIALRLLDYLLRTDAFQRPGRTDPISPPVATSARLPEMSLGDLTFHAGLFVALAAAWAVWWLLERSTTGYRMRAVGASPSAARYAGMSVAATYVLTMALAGGLAGLAGTSNLLGRPNFSLSGGFSFSLGFDGIAVALLGRANPAGVVAAAFLFGVLRAGERGMQAATGTSIDIIVVIQALVIMFVAAPALVHAIYRVREARGAEATFAAGWGQ